MIDGDEYAKANIIGDIFKRHNGFLVDIGDSRNLVTSGSFCIQICDLQ